MISRNPSTPSLYKGWTWKQVLVTLLTTRGPQAGTGLGPRSAPWLQFVTQQLQQLRADAPTQRALTLVTINALCMLDFPNDEAVDFCVSRVASHFNL